MDPTTVINANSGRPAEAPTARGFNPMPPPQNQNGQNGNPNLNYIHPDSSSNPATTYQQHRERALSYGSQLLNQPQVLQTTPNEVLETTNSALEANTFALEPNTLALVTLTLDECMYDGDAEKILLHWWSSERTNWRAHTQMPAAKLMVRTSTPASSTRTRSSSFAWKSSRLEAGRFS
jgi:hypothetical protein